MERAFLSETSPIFVKGGVGKVGGVDGLDGVDKDWRAAINTGSSLFDSGFGSGSDLGSSSMEDSVAGRAGILGSCSTGGRGSGSTSTGAGEVISAMIGAIVSTAATGSGSSACDVSESGLEEINSEEMTSQLSSVLRDVNARSILERTISPWEMSPTRAEARKFASIWSAVAVGRDAA